MQEENLIDGRHNDFVFVGQVTKNGEVYALACSWDWVVLVTDPVFDGMESYTYSRLVAEGKEAMDFWVWLVDENGGRWDVFEEVWKED